MATIAGKSGRMRTLAAMSLDHDNPFWWRNIPFSQLPFSAFIVMCLIAVATPSVPAQTALILAGFACFITGLAFLVHPPRFLKPDWLRDEERRRGASGHHPSPVAQISDLNAGTPNVFEQRLGT